MTLLLAGVHCCGSEATPSDVPSNPGITDFGSESLPPISTGIFIYRNAYVLRPYVVSRRGLAVYINDNIVDTGPEWPPFDLTVAIDPGDPPPDSAPWNPPVKGTDPRQGYWARKFRYLTSHLDAPEARRAYINLIEACHGVANVVPRADEVDVIDVHFIDGHALPMEIGNETLPQKIGHDEALEDARQSMKRFATSLKAGQLVGILKSLGEWSIDNEGKTRFFEILLSNKPESRKLELLASEHFIKLSDTVLTEALAHFNPGGDELYLRFGMVPPSYAKDPIITGLRPKTAPDIVPQPIQVRGVDATRVGILLGILVIGIAIYFIARRRSR